MVIYIEQSKKYETEVNYAKIRKRQRRFQL